MKQRAYSVAFVEVIMSLEVTFKYCWTSLQEMIKRIIIQYLSPWLCSEMLCFWENRREIFL